MIVRLFVVLLAAAGACGCKPAASPEPPPVDSARAAEKAAAEALTACIAGTGLMDKLRGENGAFITLDEIKTCGPDLLSLGSAAVRLHQAEQLEAAKLRDAGIQ